MLHSVVFCSLGSVVRRLSCFKKGKINIASPKIVAMDEDDFIGGGGGADDEVGLPKGNDGIPWSYIRILCAYWKTNFVGSILHITCKSTTLETASNYKLPQQQSL
jgi:hypothetical protein